MSVILVLNGKQGRKLNHLDAMMSSPELKILKNILKMNSFLAEVL